MLHRVALCCSLARSPRAVRSRFSTGRTTRRNHETPCFAAFFSCHFDSVLISTDSSCALTHAQMKTQRSIGSRELGRSRTQQLAAQRTPVAPASRTHRARFRLRGARCGAGRSVCFRHSEAAHREPGSCRHRRQFPRAGPTGGAGFAHRPCAGPRDLCFASPLACHPTPLEAAPCTPNRLLAPPGAWRAPKGVSGPII